MADTLNVWYHTHKTGIVRHAGKGKVIFQYTKEWLGFADAFAISLSLPLQEHPFSPEISTAYFDNLLPEEHQRIHLAREKGVQPTATFDLLKAQGAECAGALAVLPMDAPPLSEKYVYTPITYEQLTHFISALPTQPLTGGHEAIRLSLAGAQSKGALRMYADGTFALPQHGAPSTHIIKAANAIFPHLPENEIFCMGTAKHVGLEVPPFFLTPTLPNAYVIERYDRRITDNTVQKLHQEDFCQALGLYSKDKYHKNSNTATLPQCFHLLQYCENPEYDRKRLLEWVVFNVCIGNADAHAKNISLLYTGKKPCLAPFYDMVSTVPYKVSQNLALKIGNQNNANHLYKRKWQQFASNIHMDYTDVCSVCVALTSTLLNIIDMLTEQFYSQYGFVHELPSIVETVKKRTHFLLKEWNG